MTTTRARRPGPTKILLTCLAAALVSGACSVGAGVTSTPVPQFQTTDSTQAALDPAPVGAFDTRPKEIPGGYPAMNSEPGRLTDVRVARQDGFDRIVLQFDSDLVPSWKAAYIAPPVTADGSGDVVPVDGTAFLQVSVAPASGYGDTGPTTADRIALPGGAAVHEVVKIGDFEGLLAWAAGISGERPFAVTTYRNPARLVIDVQHP